MPNEAIFNLISSTRKSEELKNLIKTGQAEIDLARRKGNAAEYIDDLIRGRRTAIQQWIKKWTDEELSRINKQIEKNEAGYKVHVENAADRPFNISLRRDSIAAMTDSELKILAVKLQKGETDIFDPAEINIILAAVKNISKPLFEQTREAMIEQNYTEPWRKLLSPADQKTKEIIEAGLFPAIAHRGEGYEAEVISIDANSFINSIK